MYKHKGLAMARRIHITAVRKDEPDIRLYVLALIALARQLRVAEIERAAGEQPVADRPARGEADHD